MKSGWLTVLLYVAVLGAGGAAAVLANPPETVAPRVSKIGPDLFQCGEVRIHAGKRWLRFPARVHGEEGPLEYALVLPSGAQHESLLLTDVDPVDIHTGALLLGAVPVASGSGAAAATGSGPIDADSLKRLPDPVGKPVQIWVEFKSGNEVRRERLESWLEWRTEGAVPRRARVPETHWLYTGSSVFEGRFAAKEEGNLFALALSSAALVNIPLPENRNDRAWYSRAGFVPGKGVPVQVEICFEVSKKDGRQ